MTHNQLSHLENGCNGRMKLENGKIVFEFESIQLEPQPNTPPLIVDDHLADELRETKQRLADLEKRVQDFFTFHNTVGNAGYNFECDKIRFCECMNNLQHCGVGFKVTLGDENRLYGEFADHSPYAVKGVKSFRNLRTICLDFSYPVTASRPENQIKNNV